MLYRFLKYIIKYAIKRYFREVSLQNTEAIPEKGPVLFLPNHRSALLDPMVVAALLKRPVHFLARGESFKNPMVARFLATLNMIPVYRKAHASSDEMSKNDEIFQHCHTLLEQQGALMIFPEGASQTKPILLALKTGSARIALGAEAKNDFKLGVKIIPVGINYTHPHHFQEKLFLNFGEPIEVSKYAESYKNDAWQTVLKLTEDIETELRKRIAVMDDDRWQKFTQNIESMVQSDPAQFNLSSHQKDAEWFIARKDIAECINFFRKEKKDMLQSMEHKVESYFRQLDRLGIRESTLNPLGKKNENRTNPWAVYLYFFLGLFLFIPGYLFHILPFKSTAFLSKKMTLHKDFSGSITVLMGLLVYTANAILLCGLVYYLSHNIFITLAFFFILPGLGLFAYQYLNRLKRWFKTMRFYFIQKRKTEMMLTLAEEREEIMKEFKSHYEEYKKRSPEINGESFLKK